MTLPLFPVIWTMCKVSAVMIDLYTKRSGVARPIESTSEKIAALFAT